MELLIDNLIRDLRLEVYNETNSIDFYGDKIFEGDYLTYDWFDESQEHQDLIKYIPDVYEREIYKHQARFVVKINDEGYLYGAGVDTSRSLYMHSFRFKFTKIVKNV